LIARQDPPIVDRVYPAAEIVAAHDIVRADAHAEKS